jgi:glycosyltransferase involved in cell wall biosynthesis
MACGVPVITSKTSSMPEVAGNAAVYVNPFNADDIANAIFDLDKDKQKQSELITNGLNRIKNFTWQKNAELTIKMYENTLLGN